MNWDTYNTKSIKSKYLYRYVSLEKMIHFLSTGSLYFSRMDSFEDNLEGITPDDITKLIMNLKPVPSKELRSNEIDDSVWENTQKNRFNNLLGLQKKLNEKQTKHFVSCWFLGDTESIGMWDLYATDGFLIRFERLSLQNLVKEKHKTQSIDYKDSDLLVAGKVKYQDFEKVAWENDGNLIKYSGFRKHEAFKHEEEYRFIIHKLDPPENGIIYKLDEIDNLDFKIYANPRMSSFTFNTYSNILKKYSLKHELNESMLKQWLEFKNMTF
jgi:hypothetical protein